MESKLLTAKDLLNGVTPETLLVCNNSAVVNKFATYVKSISEWLSDLNYKGQLINAIYESDSILINLSESWYTIFNSSNKNYYYSIYTPEYIISHSEMKKYIDEISRIDKNKPKEEIDIDSFFDNFLSQTDVQQKAMQAIEEIQRQNDEMMRQQIKQQQLRKQQYHDIFSDIVQKQGKYVKDLKVNLNGEVKKVEAEKPKSSVTTSNYKKPLHQRVQDWWDKL